MDDFSDIILKSKLGLRSIVKEKKMGFYNDSVLRSKLGLQVMVEEDREMVGEVIDVLRNKELTGERASNILKDARSLIPFLTTLE